ncbi:MAG: ABC transporter substrate-binding protein [Clostridiales bacterium]|nr:ABC transporter substrate-binding protein [Clostridiales bacterium]
MRRFLPLLLAALLLFTACSPQQNPFGENGSGSDPSEPQITFTDDLGRRLSLAKPQRVAALIGSFADIWCLAGGKDSLIAAAADSWTSFDLELSDTVTNIGSVKEPNLERILASQPDLILASCNTAADLELLSTFEKAGIPAAYFEVETFEDYLRMLKICCSLTGDAEAYKTYGTAVSSQIETARSRVPSFTDGEAPSVLYIRATGSSCKAKASEGSVLGSMLKNLGCINIADSTSSLLETLSLEAIIQADPDYIFVVLQGADPTKAKATLQQTLLSNPAWSNLRAVKEGRFHTMDHFLYNLKPNDRWGDAYEALADILYPKQ